LIQITASIQHFVVPRSPLDLSLSEFVNGHVGTEGELFDFEDWKSIMIIVISILIQCISQLIEVYESGGGIRIVDIGVVLNPDQQLVFGLWESDHINCIIDSRFFQRLAQLIGGHVGCF